MSEERENEEELKGLSREAADALASAKAKAALAEAAKLRSEALKAATEAAQAEVALKTQQLAYEKVVEAEEKRRTDNDFYHILEFDGPVLEATVQAAMATLDWWKRIEPGCDITIVFSSPGGDVIAGMALFDYLMELRKEGHKLTTVARGYAASMAGILLQAGTVRQCGRESYVLIHEITAAVRGKVGEIEDEMIFIKKIQSRVLDIFATRAAEAKEKGTAKCALSKKQFDNRWKRKDWWIDSQEALDYGVVDEIVG